MSDRKVRTLLAALSLMWLALSACSRQEQDEMTWARAALERNDRLEIIGSDPKTRTFTVRNRDTRELSIVRADQLVAGPGRGPLGTSPAPAPTAPVAAADTMAPTAAPETAEPAAGAGARAEAAPVSAPATALASAGEAAEPPTPMPVTKLIASRALLTGGKARRVPGQVLVAGPGYSIEAGSGSDAGSGAAAGAAIEAGSGPMDAAALHAPAASGPRVELRHEPIVCQGVRLLHIDNRNLQFDGDAVSAQDGCEVHITNSRIHAVGVGVTARAANVHIDNSQIEGEAASIELSDGAQIYTTSSKFQGMSRRLDTAAVHDLGGNVWN